MKEISFHEAISGSLEFIENRLTEPFSIGELAEQAFFSKSHYQRLFHAVVGEPVMEYIKKRRLQLACQDLRDTKTSVLDIALKYGYASHEGFTRAFKTNFRLSPSQYRRINAKTGAQKNLFYGEEVKMLSTKVLDRILKNMETMGGILNQFISEADKIYTLAEKTAAADERRSGAVKILSCELHHLVARTSHIKNAVLSFTGRGLSEFEVFEKIYAILKDIDNSAFQMSLLRLFSGVETGRIGNPKDDFMKPFLAIDEGFGDLSVKLNQYKQSLVNLIDELVLLIKADIQKEARAKLDQAAGLLKETIEEGVSLTAYAQGASESLGNYGRAYGRIAAEVERRTAEVSAVAGVLSDPESSNVASAVDSLQFSAFHMNVNTFNAAVETARSGGFGNLPDCTEKIRRYAGRLQQTYASCAELYNEYVRLSGLCKQDAAENKNALRKKMADDLLFQGELLAIQFSVEAERANRDNFRALAKRASECQSVLLPLKRNPSPDYEAAFAEYQAHIASIAQDCHLEATAAEGHGYSFEYMGKEYGHFAEKIRQSTPSNPSF